MVEKVLEVEYIMLFMDIRKLIINMWKIMIKMKNHRILSKLDVNYLHG